MNPVTPDTLAYRGSALEAFDEMARNKTSLGLLHTAHAMWCGDSCSRDGDCAFLHYKRREPRLPNAPARSPRHRYNKDTANFFTLMGGEGYKPGTPQEHQVNFWPIFESVLRKVDHVRGGGGLLFCDYTDWTKRQDSSAGMTIEYLSRDTIQWMASWYGTDLSTTALDTKVIASVVIPDDLCIPPLDFLHQRVRMYGRSLRDLVKEMVDEGWGRDATHILLSSVRQFFLQYIEKVEFEDNAKYNNGIHAQMGRDEQVWDSIVYRTHTANTYVVAIVVARAAALSEINGDWLFCSAVNDAISMDLGKSALRVYQIDNHNPTATFGPKETKQKLQARRQVGYHSIYLDLMDDLVNTGCPEPLVHYASAGFLFVQMQHRYLERSLGFRFPIHEAMADALRKLFGDKPTDAWLDGLFHLRWLMSTSNTKDIRTNSTLCPDLLAACLKRQEQRKSAWDSNYAGSSKKPEILMDDPDIHCPCAADWARAIHTLSSQATNPDELQRLLGSVISKNSLPLSSDQLATVGSFDDIWALCVAYQVDCSNNYEWLAFSKYVWKHIYSGSHTTQGCHTEPSTELKNDSGVTSTEIEVRV
ncbi:hypothetical protein F4776DRAFT_677493 [Hypoxylon sp. NC0597]|nr:hypothetical protein F4776DRAFT_677493 [Hypoxylon sp. NC0597]